jgi:hypothetical protein
LEEDIRSQISGLQDDAEGALLQTHLIAKALQSFSRIMVRRLHSADVDGALEPAPEIQQIARQIQEHSAEVSHHVGRMCEKLTELVGTLDTVRKGDKSLKERIWRWLKRIFQVLATLFAVGAAVATPFNPLFGVLLGIGSVISSAASVMSSTMSEKGMYICCLLISRSGGNQSYSFNQRATESSTRFSNFFETQSRRRRTRSRRVCRLSMHARRLSGWSWSSRRGTWSNSDLQQLGERNIFGVPRIQCCNWSSSLDHDA